MPIQDSLILAIAARLRLVRLVELGRRKLPFKSQQTLEWIARALRRGQD